MKIISRAPAQTQETHRPEPKTQTGRETNTSQPTSTTNEVSLENAQLRSLGMRSLATNIANPKLDPTFTGNTVAPASKPRIRRMQAETPATTATKQEAFAADNSELINRANAEITASNNAYQIPDIAKLNDAETENLISTLHFESTPSALGVYKAGIDDVAPGLQNAFESMGAQYDPPPGPEGLENRNTTAPVELNPADEMRRVRSALTMDGGELRQRADLISNFENSTPEEQSQLIMQKTPALNEIDSGDPRLPKLQEMLTELSPEVRTQEFNALLQNESPEIQNLGRFFPELEAANFSEESLRGVADRLDTRVVEPGVMEGLGDLINEMDDPQQLPSVLELKGLLEAQFR